MTTGAPNIDTVARDASPDPAARTGTAGTSSVPVPHVRPAAADTGTTNIRPGTDAARTKQPRTARTGTGWFPRRNARHSRTGTSPTPAPAPAPVGTGTDEPGTDRSEVVQAARVESALRAAARTTAPAAGTGRRKNGPTADDLPVWPWLKNSLAYASRLISEMPLIAPMIVSGYYTFGVGREALMMPVLFALLMVAALEGAAIKLVVLYRKRLVAGFGTIAERIGIIGIVSAIGALIYWHATTKVGTQGGFNDVLKAADWRPAAVAAAMSALGVYVNSRQARWDHRAELLAKNLIDMQALRIGIWQWITSPWESLCGFRHGMKRRIGNPAEAVRDWQLWKTAGKPAVWPPTLADVLGTDRDQPVTVPAWLLDTLIAGTTSQVGTGTTSASRTGTTAGTTGTGFPTGTGTGGTGGTGTTGTGGGEDPTRTGAGTGEAPGGGTGTPPAGTADGGTDAHEAHIARLRTKHAARLAAVRANLRGRSDPDTVWNTMPTEDLSLSRICAAGDFRNKTDAGEVKQVLLHDRKVGSQAA